MTDVTMPRLSDTMEEGTIATWLKQPGDQVERGDVLAQVETDKATMDLTAFESGTLQEILAEPGTTVPIGQPVARIGTGAPPARRSQPPAPQAAPDRPTPAESAPAAGTGSRASAQTAPAEQQPEAAREQPPGGAAATGSHAAQIQPAEDGAEHANGAAGKLRASPMARHIAAEHGLDLGQLHGSGPLGRVIRADVEAALASAPADQSQQAAPASAAADGQQPAAAAAPTQPAPAPSAGTEQGGMEARPQSAELDGDERVPLSQMRRTIARRMVESVTTTPHFYLTTTVDATDLVALRAQLIAQAEAAGEPFKVSLNDLILRAVAVALRRMPEVNVSYAEQDLIRHAHVNLGIAVATERGLIVPVIRDADQKSISQLAREARDLAERGRDGKLQPADYRGGTFTVSNLGMFGIDFFTAVINPPEAGILAVGAVVREPAEYQGQIALRERMHLTLSVDHRALDGAVGARFLQLLKKLLEQPLLTV